RRSGRSLFFGQSVDEIIHDDISHLDVFTRSVVDMVATDGEGIAITAEDENMQVRTAEGNAAGEWQGATVNVVGAMSLHEIRESAGTANAGYSGDIFMPDLALFNQLKVEGKHTEIAATGAPGGVIGGDFLFGKAFALDGQGWNHRSLGRSQDCRRRFRYKRSHNIKC
ncbi:MAG: hypothetical protein JWM04_1633, partial [Verrucomicrobiales bacterium]|nr:hypothetical protein [Verrucomicrobiales bacterium]